MFGRDTLVELAYRDGAGRLEKTLAAFGEFLQIHVMSLSSGDSPPHVPAKKATRMGFATEVGRGRLALKGD
jgi:hypothetical protein